MIHIVYGRGLGKKKKERKKTRFLPRKKERKHANDQEKKQETKISTTPTNKRKKQVLSFSVILLGTLKET